MGSIVRSLSVLIVCTVVIGLIHHLFYSQTISGFCDSLDAGTSLETVMAQVEANELTVFTPDISYSGTLVITNHNSPFFRLGCFVELEQGLVVEKYFSAAD